MIIEKNALYQALQSAFSTHHKRFPWPKRHDLEDQTEKFQAAFDEFSDYVNETVRAEIIEQRKIEVDHYTKRIESLRAELKTATSWNIFFMFVFGLCIGAFALGFTIGLLG